MTYMSRKRITSEQSRKNHSIAMKSHKHHLLCQYQVIIDAYFNENYNQVEINILKDFIKNAFIAQKKNGLVVREKFYFENVNELASILKLTKFIDVPTKILKASDFDFIERMHCIMNDINERPKCQFCKCREVKFISGKRQYADSCIVCEVDKSRKTKGLKTSNEMTKDIEALGYEVLQFPNKIVNNGKLVVRCNKCNKISEHRIFNGRIQHLEQMHLCSHCDKYVSNPEKELRQTIQLLVPGEQLLFNDRNVIAPYELDIVLPRKKIAFEYNGFYWHNERLHRPNYHAIKMKKCNGAGYQLFQIFENEWMTKRQHVVRCLRNILNVNELVVNDDNNCRIRELNNNDACKFFNDNLLHEHIPSSINIGIFSHEELVYVMSFAKSKHSKNIQYEMTQFCNKSNVKVKDAFQACLKYFENIYCPKSIVAYLNCRWSENRKLFSDNNWKLIKKTQPVGWYYKNGNLNQLISPMKLTNRFMKENLEKFNPTKSKRENMYDNGYIRIFDCGSLVFVKTY